MTDIDEPLTLPVEDDDDDAGARHESTERTSHHAEPVAATELIALSSSEARLATALLMQAQALEGMRREQSDLLKRLEAGPTRAALVRTLGQVEAALKQVARLQQKARGQIARTRRRSTRLIAASLILTLGLLGVVGWMAWSMRTELPETLSTLESRLAEAEASRAGDVDRAVTAAVALASAGPAEALAALSDRLDGEHTRLLGELTVLEGEKDAAFGALDGARNENADLQAKLASLEAGQAALDQQLNEARNERNRQFGENARLVEQVMSGEARLQELAQTVADLRLVQPALGQPVAAAILETAPAAPFGLPGRITSSLKLSGAADWTVLEVDAVSDGALLGVLLRKTTPDNGPVRVLHAGRAWIVIEGGRPRLRLDPVREQGQDQDEVLEIELPALDAITWRALGMAVPGGFTPLPVVQAALDEMLVAQGWRVSRLTSFDGNVLGGLELVLEDENGIVQRTLRAGSGFVLPSGPELELRDGSIQVGADERPFYRGVFLLPMPGSDFGGWLVATDGSAW